QVTVLHSNRLAFCKRNQRTTVSSRKADRKSRTSHTCWTRFEVSRSHHNSHPIRLSRIYPSSHAYTPHQLDLQSHCLRNRQMHSLASKQLSTPTAVRNPWSVIHSILQSNAGWLR